MCVEPRVMFYFPERFRRKVSNDASTSKSGTEHECPAIVLL
jgi:hypothetical protein